MLFHDGTLGDYDLRPEAGLGMDHHMIPNYHAGADNRIILDIAMFPDMGIVVHDTAGYRAVGSDNHPVI